MPIKIHTEPAREPVEIDLMKVFLRVNASDETFLIESCIKAARDYAEEFMRRALVTQTWEITLPGFPDLNGPIILPLPPLQTVTSVTYIDDNGTSTVMSSALYSVDTVSEPGRIHLAYGEDWPSTRDQWNAVVVRYVCGYGNPEAVPVQIRQGLMADVSGLFENRGDVPAPEFRKVAETLYWSKRVEIV